MKNITFRKISSLSPVVDYLKLAITQKLAAGQKVLWLVPGGSAMQVAAAASQGMPKELLGQLTVNLTDERYGPVDHPDSNWPQLRTAGFNLPGADLQSVLTGQDLRETTQIYARTLMTDFDKADYSLALIGMGPDGHILGIKPHSPAVDSPELTAGYKGDDFVRVTMTAHALDYLDEVVVYAVGIAKWPQLDALEKPQDPSNQPAQLLKNLKKVIIFNDYKGAEG